MTKKTVRITALLLALVLLAAPVTASAAGVQASNYFSRYGAQLSSGGSNKLTCYVTIDATRSMSLLGWTSVELQQKQTGGSYVGILWSYDYYRYNTINFTGSVSFSNLTKGATYRCLISARAEDSTGGYSTVAFYSNEFICT